MQRIQIAAARRSEATSFYRYRYSVPVGYPTGKIQIHKRTYEYIPVPYREDLDEPGHLDRSEKLISHHNASVAQDAAQSRVLVEHNCA
eukprot:COSAG05_NODE_2926_length_2496_cov_6.589070_2_plen_88_part_00